MVNRIPPRVRVPGRGAGRSIPSGYFVGRVSAGRGPLEIIKPQQLGIATAKQTQNQLAVCGFTFYEGGLMLAGEDLGQGTWAHNVTFVNGVEGSNITSLFPAAASAVFDIYNVVGGVPSVFGTITFAAHSQIGVLNFPSLYVVTAGTPVRLNAPASADATLASVSGTVVGFRS